MAIKENNLSGKIVKVLSKHPEGLTFADLARELGAHRHTVTKYIYEMKGAKIIRIRDLGTLKLCYISKKGKAK